MAENTCGVLKNDVRKRVNDAVGGSFDGICALMQDCLKGRMLFPEIQGHCDVIRGKHMYIDSTKDVPCWLKPINEDSTFSLGITDGAVSAEHTFVLPTYPHIPMQPVHILYLWLLVNPKLAMDCIHSPVMKHINECTVDSSHDLIKKSVVAVIIEMYEKAVETIGLLSTEINA